MGGKSTLKIIITGTKDSIRYRNKKPIFTFLNVIRKKDSVRMDTQRSEDIASDPAKPIRFTTWGESVSTLELY